MTQPKVSIIIPVYGVEKYLEECLDSVINQTLKDIEIILIDDGGKDKCPQIIDEYASKDSRIKAIHKKNGGYGHSCNRGLEEATGEYIGIVEPDDYIDKNMYEDLYNLAINNNVDIIKSAYWEEFEADEEIPEHEIYTGWARTIIPPKTVFNIEEYSDFLYHHPSIWSCIYKKNFLKENNIKFVEAKGGGWVDNPFQVETMCLAKRIMWTPKAYYNYRPESVGNSSKLVDYSIPVARFNEIHDFFDKHPDIYEKVFYNITKKEIAYIYSAYKTGFRNITDNAVIEKMGCDIKNLLNRIPKEYLKTNKFKARLHRHINKMMWTNYPLRFYYYQLKKGLRNENSVL